MNSYILVLIADLLLAVMFTCQKKYQEKAGTSVKSNLIYTILSGAFSAVIFLVINQFTIKITLFSIVMAMLFAGLITAYVFIGFAIMKKGSMSLYTLFLMSGGMTVPYIYGVIFLNEELTVLRTLGLLLMICAVAATNFQKGKTDVKQLLLCVAVFVLNGFVSVVSKMHQISPASSLVSPPDFVFLAMVSKVVISVLAMFFRKDARTEKVSVPLKSVVVIVFIAAAVDGISYMLQLMGASNLPASVLYPLITGGTIVLSTFVDRIVCKGKITPQQWIGTGVAFLGTLMFL